ncbi:MAG: adenosine deaminase [Bacillota bacterium]
MNIKSLPKIDLHSHLDGSIDPKTIFELSKKDNIKIPTDSFDSFKEYVKVSNDCDSLKTYLKKFIYPINIMQTKTNLEKVSYEYVLNLSNDNIKYAEVRFAPFLHTKNNLKIEEIISSVIKGLKRGYDDTGITVNIIICAMRSMSNKKALVLFEKAKKFLGYGVVGVDLAGNEQDYPPEIYTEAFKKAKKIGYNITIHAGETGKYKNIETAINKLNASRIGHGISAIKSQKTIDLIKEKNITLEICPTSNIQTKAIESYKNHPFYDFYKKGVNVVLNTDNSTVSNTTMNKEYEIMVNTFNLKKEDLMNIHKNSIKSSFASNTLKTKLLDNLN